MQSPLSQHLGTENVALSVGTRVRSALGRRARDRTALTIALALGDALAVCAAFTLAYLLRFKTAVGAFYVPPNSPLLFYSSLVFWLVPLILITFAAYRLYHLDELFDGVEEYTRIVSATTLSIILVILVSFFFDDRLIISRAWLILSWALLMLCVGVGRFLMRRVVYALRRAGRLGRRVLLVGGQDAVDLGGQLHTSSAGGFHVARVVDPRTLGNTGRLSQLLAETRSEAVVISAASVPQEILSTIVRELSTLPTDLHIVPGMYDVLTTGVQVRTLRGLPLVTMNKVRITGVELLVKQLVDYAVAALALLVLAPLLLGIALAIRLTSPGPIFHRRRVVGQCGRRFNALKFRTMYVDGDAILARRPELAECLAREGKLVEDPRVTPIGRRLRRWSLDEVPQLFNVLWGQMSLVGPRMISEGELAHFGSWRENLTTVKPGLTGLWQVSGRSNLGYEDRVRLDMHYIRTYSIWSDLEILARTVPAVIAGVGAY